MHFVAYGNTKKSLNIVNARTMIVLNNSIRFPCPSNNSNFNTFLPKKPVNHGIAFNKQNETRC